ncbi:10959_t:CDS:2 [Funneliformis caledonium]|uniref:10959_t:CDS:1 n=1 Tax=Funneliformis caledonium TaxID=1117310 RepID=A0A9N9HXL8_9GLOM|nr:10959_t:CDS:2 [Funneliformis caledonium]
MPRERTKRPNNSRARGVMTHQFTSSRNGMTTSRARDGMTHQTARSIKQSEDHENDIYEDYDYKDYIDVDQDKDVQESFDETYSLKTSNVNRIQYIQNDISAVTICQTINQRILPAANVQVTNTIQKNTRGSLSFPITTYSRNRSVDKESSSKYHDKRSHINDFNKILFEVFKQKESLSEIQPDLNKQIVQKDINEAKILFLRSHDLSTVAYNTLLKSIALGFSENSKMISFLKMKLSSYFADHQSCLNTKARVYAEDYINNNDVEDLASYVDDTVIFQCIKNLMAQITEEWWEDDTDSVDVFRFFIATIIRIHIINVLKCNDDSHLTNTSALNEIKTLNYITCELHLPHNNSTNYANEIGANLLNNSLSQDQIHDRKCRRSRGQEHSRDFRRNSR